MPERGSPLASTLLALLGGALLLGSHPAEATPGQQLPASRHDSPILVVGTGTIGRQVLRSLLEHGATQVKALVRPGSSTSKLPAGVEPVLGDLADRESLERALHGVTGVFFITPHSPDEELLGTNLITAAERTATMRRLVYSSAIHPSAESPLLRQALHSGIGLVTHYGRKLRVEDRVRRSSLDPVVLLPANFYGNDLLHQDSIVRMGVYPLPLGRRGTARVDEADIGLAAARALLLPEEVPSGAYALVGPERCLNGPQCAQVWSDVLGRPVVYGGDDLQKWAALVKGSLPDASIADFVKTFRLIQLLGPRATARALQRTRLILGRAPTPYRAFVEAAVRSWEPAPAPEPEPGERRAP